MALAVAFIVAYIPFAWYLIDSIIKERSESAADKRQREYRRKKSEEDMWEK